MAQLLRADLLPEAWIAPPAVRQLRALLRHRTGLVRLRTQLQNRIRAVVADFGYDRSGIYLSGPGCGWLAGLEPPAVSPEIVTDCLTFIDALRDGRQPGIIQRTVTPTGGRVHGTSGRG